MSSPASFAVIVAASVTAVLLAEALKRFRVPIVVLEVILGILIGPAVLHWAQHRARSSTASPTSASRS